MPADSETSSHAGVPASIASPGAASGAASPAIGAATLDGRVLAESIRWLEADGDRSLGDPALPPGGELEDRVVARAGALGVTAAVTESIDGVRGWIRGLAVLLVFVGLGIGAAAAAGAVRVGEAESVNLVWCLLSLLGVQTALLLVWLAVTVIRPRVRATSPLLIPINGLLGWFARSGLDGAHVRDRTLTPRTRTSAAARGIAAPLATPGIARATAGTLTHAWWTAFNVGALVTLVLLFLSVEYRFSWETTLLDATAGERIVRTIAAGPEAVGLVTLDDDTIERGRPAMTGAQTDADRTAFSLVLIGAIALYGLVPRGLLLGMSAITRSVRLRRWRLDLDRPGYARQRARLTPSGQGVPAARQAGTLPTPVAPPAPEIASAPDPVAGEPAILRLETDADGAWPPPLEGVRWQDLGPVDGRTDERRVLEALDALDPAPARVVAVASLTMTPDRGVERFLGEVRGEGTQRLRLVLTGGHALYRRSGAAAVHQRTAVWQQAAARVGLRAGDTLELDLAHATPLSLDRLHALMALDRPRTEAEHESHLDSALDVIVAAAASWTAAPTAIEQAELHRVLQRRYRVTPSTLRTVFGSDPGNGDSSAEPNAAAGHPGDAADHLAGLARAAGRLPEAASAIGQAATDPDAAVAERLRVGANRLLDRLPPGLRASPRWAAAGAVAGTCGCIAAAAAFSPLAIAALPTWAGAGAIIGAIVRATRRSAGANDPDGGAADIGGPGSGDPAVVTGAAIDAAVLLVLVLELQGRSEAVVAELLERTLGDLPPSVVAPGDGPSARRVAETVRDRFDAAMASVSVSTLPVTPSADPRPDAGAAS